MAARNWLPFLRAKVRFLSSNSPALDQQVNSQSDCGNRQHLEKGDNKIAEEAAFPAKDNIAVASMAAPAESLGKLGVVTLVCTCTPFQTPSSLELPSSSAAIHG